MATIASLTGKVSIEGASKAADDLKSVSKGAKEGAGGLKGLLGQGLAFAGAQVGISSVGDAFGFVKDQLGSMLSAGLEANRMDDILAQGLRSTHDASGMTTQSLDQLSTKIMGLSGIDDDSVKSAEQMLLTFTGIGKNAFPAATQAAADMATRMNGGAIPSAQQMQDAALQLGKALNDPATGMTALQRVGVTFTQAQKDQIKAMQASGDSAGAQAVILKELQKEFGGSAEAAGRANGGMAIMTASVNNAKQQIGQALAPAVSDLTAKLAPLVVQVAQKVAPALTNLISFLSAHQQVLPIIAGVIGGVLVAAFAAWAISAAAAAIATLAAAAPFIAVAAGIAFLVIGIKLLLDHLPQILGFFGGIAAAIGNFIGNALGAIGNFFGNLIGLVITGVKTLLGWYLWPYEQVWNFLQGILPKIGAFLHDAWDTIVKDVSAVVSGIFTYVKWVFTTDLAFIQSVMGAIGGFLHTAWNTIVGDVKGVVSGFLGIFQAIGSGISGAMKGAINLVIGDINAFIRFLDGIQIHIPSIGVGPVHTPAFDWAGLNLGQIPYLARGGSVGVSGLFVGAEEGVELLTTPGVYRAPAGSHVYSASDTARMLGSGGGGIPDGPLVIQIAGRTVAQLLWPDLIKEARRSSGLRI